MFIPRNSLILAEVIGNSEEFGKITPNFSAEKAFFSSAKRAELFANDLLCKRRDTHSIIFVKCAAIVFPFEHAFVKTIEVCIISEADI